jgi:hypothetical protein
MNENREIFEVPGVYENPRRQTITLAFFNSLCKMSEIHGVRPQPQGPISHTELSVLAGSLNSRFP